MSTATLLKAAGGVAVAVGGAMLHKFVSESAAKAAEQLSGESVARAVQTAKNAMLDRMQGTDLISYSQPARMEPILLLDQRAIYVPFVQDVIHSLTNLYTAYFLQSIALDTTISGVKVMKRLDKFNPDRSLALATRNMLSTESFEFGLPFPGESIGMEAYSRNEETMTDEEIYASRKRDASIDKKVKNAVNPESGAEFKDVSKMVNDVQNLSVGKMIEITISENGQAAKIPVTIRLRVTAMAQPTLVETLALGGKDGSFKARWRAWRAGEIKFWRDGVFALDRIDAHRRAAMKDRSGYYRTIAKRASTNDVVEAMGNGPSIGTASSIIVMTEQTKQEVERQLGRQFRDFETRQTIFQNTYSMLIAILDPDWETVTIYHRGIEMATELSAKDLKASSKGNGPDIGEILKTFIAGQAPNRL